MATKAKTLAFIDSIAKFAQASRKKWGVPASVTLAQAVLESAAGESRLAKECNNLFGVKARQGEEYCHFKTTEFSTVRAGDTLEKISRRVDEPVENLLLLNPFLSTRQLKAGMILRLTVQAEFRKYKSLSESVDAHGKLLATLKRYQPAMAKAHDPLSFALQLQLCGYATDPNYPKKLAALIEQYGLAKYDKEAA